MSQGNIIATLIASVDFSIVRRQIDDGGNGDTGNSVTNFGPVSGTGASSHLFPRYMFGVIIVAVLILIGTLIAAYYLLRKRQIRKRVREARAAHEPP
jgi:NADH:ubiquinone oxidoreductase subunit 6 (subunit J)